jgi:[protein-PII] uridylyltransferase
VGSYGERAVDAFYVTDADGSKPREAERLSSLREDLMAVLSGRARPEPARATPEPRPGAAGQLAARPGAA